MGVNDYSLNPDNNTQINGINIAEGCLPSGINDAIRQLMADVKADSDEQNDALQKAVNDNVGSATKLANKRTIDGMQFDGSANIHHYGVCSTAVDTAAKTVTLAGFALATGARITVRFTATNTATSPTLNVNSTGAKPIQYRNAAIAPGYLAANHVYEFVYDGASWELVGDINTDTNTKYGAASTSNLGLVKVGTNLSVASDGTLSVASASTSGKGVVQLSSATNSTSTTLAATASAVKTAYDKGVSAATAASKAQTAATAAQSAADAAQEAADTAKTTADKAKQAAAAPASIVTNVKPVVTSNIGSKNSVIKAPSGGGTWYCCVSFEDIYSTGGDKRTLYKTGTYASGATIFSRDMGIEQVYFSICIRIA